MTIHKIILLFISVCILFYAFFPISFPFMREGMDTSKINSEAKTTTEDNEFKTALSSDLTVKTTAPAETSLKGELPLKELVIKSAWNCALNDVEEPSLDALKKVLLSGCRFIDLHICVVSKDDNDVMYVCNGDKYGETVPTTLPLSEALNTIQQFGFSKPSGAQSSVSYMYINDPLFVHFQLHQSSVPSKLDETKQDLLDLLFNKYLNPYEGKGLIDNSKLMLNQSQQTAITINKNTKLKTVQNKILFGFNVPNLVNLYAKDQNAERVPIVKRKVLKKMCNFKTGGHSWRANVGKSGLVPQSTQINGYNTNVDAQRIAFPEKSSNTNLDLFDMVKTYQVQTVPMKHYALDENLDVSTQFFNENKSSLVPLSVALGYINRKLAQSSK